MVLKHLISTQQLHLIVKAKLLPIIINTIFMDLKKIILSKPDHPMAVKFDTDFGICVGLLIGYDINKVCLDR